MDIPVRIPDRLRKAMHAPDRAAFGPAWIDDLPDRIARLADRYSLTIDLPMTEPYAEMSFNYITPGKRADGTEVILKVAYERGVYVTERSGIRLSNPEGMVSLLGTYDEDFALILESVRPGIPLSECENDEENTHIAADVMRRLWQPALHAHALRSVEDWTVGGMARYRDRHADGGPLPLDWVAAAEDAFRSLSATTSQRLVLHGDLHHFNILSSDRNGWLAIDPKGMEGDPGYELGAFMGNELPDDTSGWPDLLSRRIEIFSEDLDIPWEHLVTWSWAHAVLVSTWCERSGDDWASTMKRAEIIRRLP